MTKIGFSEYGRVYVRLYFKPQRETAMRPIRFKVDTGADASTISKMELLDLGYDMDWIRKNAIVFKDEDKPTTASGDKIDGFPKFIGTRLVDRL
jgi:hypothetical protein